MRSLIPLAFLALLLGFLPSRAAVDVTVTGDWTGFQITTAELTGGTGTGGLAIVSANDQITVDITATGTWTLTAAYMPTAWDSNLMITLIKSGPDVALATTPTVVTTGSGNTTLKFGYLIETTVSSSPGLYGASIEYVVSEP